MPFLGMVDKVRQDPMGPAAMGLLKNNAELVRRLALVEHIASTGEHNAREIPRVVRRISGTTVSPASSDITSVVNGGAGVYTLTLAGARFDADWMSVQINPCGADVANKPYMIGYHVISATSIAVYLHKLTSTFGDAGDPNTWAATNIDFDIAIHSEPLAAGSFSTGLPSNSIMGDPLKPTRWSALVKNAGEVYAALEAEHDPATGEHLTRQVASRSGLWRYDGAAMNLVAGEASGISVSRTGTGVYEITSSAALSTQTHCFVSQAYSEEMGNPSDILKMYVTQVSTTRWDLYCYAHNTTDFTWDRADGDFWLAMHNG